MVYCNVNLICILSFISLYPKHSTDKKQMKMFVNKKMCNQVKSYINVNTSLCLLQSKRMVEKYWTTRFACYWSHKYHIYIYIQHSFYVVDLVKGFEIMVTDRNRNVISSSMMSMLCGLAKQWKQDMTLFEFLLK